MEINDKKIELGKVVGVWGVKGWVKLHSYTREREDIAQYPTWLLGAKQQFDVYEVLECRVQGQGIVAKFAGVDGRNEAELLIGKKIYIAQDDLPELPEGEFYWNQLIGLEVIDKSENRIGRLNSILETGANDVLVVKQDNTKGDGAAVPEVLIPYLPEVVLDVNLQKNLMKVDWDPAYLLDT